jgi:phospholipid-translocating ATPase
VYQGGVIMLLAMFLFENSLVNIVAITFTALILAELLNVAFEIHKWNRYIILSEIATFFLYFASMFALTSYFDVTFILTWSFIWKVVVITSSSCLPVYLAMHIKQKYDPPAHSKLTL